MNYPRKIAIGFQEGTCPLRCSKCFAFSKYAKGQKKASKMPMDKAKLLIDEIANMESVPQIQPHIFTEPFANQDLREIILCCLEKGIGMSIITNGILLDKSWLDFLLKNLDNNYTLSFSLDAVTQQTYEKVRGEYELGEIEDKIKYLVKHRCNGGPRIGVNYTVEESNYSETNDFIEKWKNKVDAVHVNLVVDFDKKIPAMFKTGNENVQMRCRNLAEVMTIDTDGFVRVCQADAFGETALGNVFDEGILNVWNGVKLSEIRTRQAERTLGREHFCYDCELSWMTNFVRYEINDIIVSKSGDYAVYYNYKEVKADDSGLE